MASAFTFNDRACGVLLHPTSLPGPYGCGDLGPAARTFIDFMSASGQRWWQMLPTAPPGLGYSPYSPFSAFAGSPLLISLDDLAHEGLLRRRDLQPPTSLTGNRVRYPQTDRYRTSRLKDAFATFQNGGGLRSAAYRRFCQQHEAWLDDYALFAALKREHGGCEWFAWSEPLRMRRATAIREAQKRFADEIEFERFCQFSYDRQWATLRDYGRQKGVALIGDIPIFVAEDSADVWSRAELFQLGKDHRPKIVTGVPPDNFSKDGQLWNHPHYNWSRHRRDGFSWWIARFRHLVGQFDGARIDHFLGFHRLWAVPFGAKNARRGKWVVTPGRELLTAVTEALGRVEIIAEDLGFVTPQAVALRDDFEYPGMRIIQNAFWSEGDFYNEPHACPATSVLYSGTHDNPTFADWLSQVRAADRKSRKPARGKSRKAQKLTQWQRVLRYTGVKLAEVHWSLLRHGYSSPANTVIYPMQDLLELGKQARMNLPGVPDGNWTWRMDPDAIDDSLSDRLYNLAAAYDRLRPNPFAKQRKASKKK
jgi:4-alpha-glucanotransferase